MEQTGQKRTFQWRAFTSFYVVISFLIISTSGITLYITPPGRVAYWSAWTLFGLTKQQWQSIHTIFTFLFVIAVALHVYFNWKVLLSYLRSRLHEGMKRRNELTLSLVVTGTVLLFTVLNFPPFSTVMVLGDDFSNSWLRPQDEPPVPHAELLNLEQFAQKTGTSLGNILDRLGVHGLTADSTTILVKDLAAQYNLTPAQLYEKMRREEDPGPALVAEGGGYGRKTVAQIAQQLDLPVEVAIERLHDNSIRADAGSVIRDLASKHNTSPIDLVRFILNERSQ